MKSTGTGSGRFKFKPAPYNGVFIQTFQLFGVFLPNEYMKEYPIVVLVRTDPHTVSSVLSGELHL